MRRWRQQPPNPCFADLGPSPSWVAGRLLRRLSPPELRRPARSRAGSSAASRALRRRLLVECTYSNPALFLAVLGSGAEVGGKDLGR